MAHTSSHNINGLRHKINVRMIAATWSRVRQTTYYLDEQQAATANQTRAA